MPRSRVELVLDEEHAARILAGLGHPAGDERDRLALALARGELLLLRTPEPEPLDAPDPHAVPLLSQLGSLGGDPIGHEPMGRDGGDPIAHEPSGRDGGDPIAHEPARALAFVALRLVSHDGQPIADVDFSIVHPDGAETVVRTDADGRARVDGIDSTGSATVRPVSAIERPPLAEGRRELPHDTIAIATDRSEPLVVALDREHTLALEPPGTVIVQLDELDFAWNRYVLLPDVEDGSSLPVTARGVLRTVLRFAEAHPDRKLLVAGHADTDGSAGNNMKVSQRRAENVLLYLQGDRTGWAAQSHAHHEVADWQAILVWVARVIGWDCDPGAVDGDCGPDSEAARSRFRSTYNARFPDRAPLDVDGPQCEADWAAFFDLYDLALARVMHIDASELGALRSKLQFVGDGVLACGEHQPKEAVGKDGFPCASNRRVDILFFAPRDEPDVAAQPPGAGVYAAGYRVVPLPVPGVGTLVVRVVDERGNPVADAEVVLACPYGARLTERTDAAGCIPVTALLGDEFAIVEVRTGDNAALVDVHHATGA